MSPVSTIITIEVINPLYKIKPKSKNKKPMPKCKNLRIK